LYGGRWNSPGHAIVYAASSLSLAALEYLVHVDVADVPADLIAMEIALPASAIVDVVTVGQLPSDWRDTAATPGCQAIGDSWLARAVSLALALPSVLVPHEQNVLLNPAHHGMAATRIVSVERFAYDPRLLR
jgi:RES domain-containing protein